MSAVFRRECAIMALRTAGVAASAVAVFLIDTWISAEVRRCRRAVQSTVSYQQEEI